MKRKPKSSASYQDVYQRVLQQKSPPGTNTPVQKPVVMEKPKPVKPEEAEQNSRHGDNHTTTALGFF